MPGTTVSEFPSVSLSFANNFWGKDDAGVSPLLDRMHNAKVTGDELKAFYTARAAIEDEYSRKLLNLSRKPLGSSESGTLRMSLDVVRGEIESMGKAHQNIASQMKSELEEPLAAFAGGIKERRKIVQSGIEKLLKVKMQQTAAVNKSRDRYEQDCLKIKGYLAQGHMVMGQEERKNKAKLEKTQIQLSNTSSEYEAAVKVLEETTGRWNRDWKAACDKFQDLEEERIDFMKSSLWNFANIASTVCVSDDQACEKIRLSLEDLEVEKDISNFIKEAEQGKKFLILQNLDDHGSEADGDENYSVAQFQRTMNPAFRSSSPQPSTFESHHDPENALAKELSHRDTQPAPVQDAVPSQQQRPRAQSRAQSDARMQPPSQPRFHQEQYSDIPKVPHNEYPMDGMTQFCRIGPPSERSSVASPVRPSSRDSQSEYSNPTSFSSFEPPSGAHSPVKENGPTPSDEYVQKKKSGFFNSPFRRRSKHEKDAPQIMPPSSRKTWAPSARNAAPDNISPTRQPGRPVFGCDKPSPSPEPVDPRANFQLNVGNNVFDVASPDACKPVRSNTEPVKEELDPVAQALAELKGVTKQSSVRMHTQQWLRGVSDTYKRHANPFSTLGNGVLSAAKRGTPPPSYAPDQPISRLGAPQPAHTARAMQQTTQKYINQNHTRMPSRPPTRGNSAQQSQEMIPRATSPAPLRAASPRPGLQQSSYQRAPSPNPYASPAPLNPRAPSPNPYTAPQVGAARPRAQSSSPVKPRQEYSAYNARGGSPGVVPRAVSPQPAYGSRPGTRGGAASPAPAPAFARQERPGSSRGSDMGGMALQLAPGPGEYGGGGGGRPQSGSRQDSRYHGGGGEFGYGDPATAQVGRVRSKSVAAPGEFTRDGRRILHYARAMYMYQAQIPEELGFAKGDILAVLRLQDDGWWEAEVVGKAGRSGLVPSNYLQQC
ncbi:formin-binding protein [Coniosporium tulheliwenetii]|uniref:Formin-binding protein n=1 Tax=Coniosporium tulheliwenetii TaxID=3383036 RepID=A0ACC2ZQ04_9PEZI|nr:formin-binding protein [Cladosporium sp. JES 115]